ncbi:ABC transporter substrate-binding protein [Lampropedia puyangensis]|uniref:ABC transporter substrate-binding protein n=2 Tax=Lampropedia puyangensis TaxID=1330072 RepID=A0A4S8FCR5_9BURK|nr:ABC transporter substrate-binding protein [Lampropedia puyangensis]
MAASGRLLAAEPVASVSADAEEAELQALYEAALKDGGKLVVYAGGDTPQQQDATKLAFAKRFPGVDIQITVDYSKIHDVRIDHLIDTQGPVPDVVQLQTLQNFPRWKKQGHLLDFKPVSFPGIHSQFRDEDGAWLAIGVLAFSLMFDASLAAEAPRSPQELAHPKWKGKIASSYPQDDDATLFLYTQCVRTYGWDWLNALAQQQVQFARGTHSVREAIAAKHALIGTGGSGSLTATDAPVRWAVAEGHPFMAWGQRAAILKQAKHANAAKLYMAWQVSRQRQVTYYNGWSVRTDVQPAGGLKPIWEYANAHVTAFPEFMQDRALVEHWRQTFALYFGDVQGPPSPGVLGLRPGL